MKVVLNLYHQFIRFEKYRPGRLQVFGELIKKLSPMSLYDFIYTVSYISTGLLATSHRLYSINSIKCFNVYADSYNDGNNILRLFDVWSNFLFTSSEMIMKLDY